MRTRCARDGCGMRPAKTGESDQAQRPNEQRRRWQADREEDGSGQDGRPQDGTDRLAGQKGAVAGLFVHEELPMRRRQKCETRRSCEGRAVCRWWPVLTPACGWYVLAVTKDPARHISSRCAFTISAAPSGE